MDVGGHPTSSGQQIWTLMDVPGRSGNTLKVPGSRPGRPTRNHQKTSSVQAITPNGRDKYELERDFSCPRPDWPASLIRTT